MFENSLTPVRQMLLGNLFLIGCCLFYLSWWIVAFRPAGGIKGMRSGWLLIPATLCGIGALILILLAFRHGHVPNILLPTSGVLIGGAVLYIIVLILTTSFLHRSVTSELFLIIGWCVLMTLELNALLGQNALSHTSGVVLLIVLFAITAVSLACYALYYSLNSRAGFWDGSVPLVCACGMTAVISCVVLIK